MDYPERFFSRMFAEARGLEIARRFAIYSLALMLLMACAAAAVVWARRSESRRPYFLYIDDAAGEWAVYGRHARESAAETPWHLLMQESVAVGFATGYLRISDSSAENENVLWCRCGNRCDADWNSCRLCCLSDGRVFEKFFNDTVPEWRKRFERGEFQEPVDVAAAPLGEATDKGGFWRVEGTLISNKSRAKRFAGFMRIERNRNTRAGTLGFYVAEFNFYAERD